MRGVAGAIGQLVIGLVIGVVMFLIMQPLIKVVSRGSPIEVRR